MFSWDFVNDIRDPGRKARAEKNEREITETPRPAQDTLEMGKVGQNEKSRFEGDSPVSGSLEEVAVTEKPKAQDTDVQSPAAQEPSSQGPVAPHSPTRSEERMLQRNPTIQSTATATSTLHSETKHTLFSIFNIPPLSIFARHFPTPTYTLKRMPWNLVPFAFSMFILVEALQYTGWIRVFGNWWTAWVKVDSTGVVGSVWLMGTLSVIGCNVSATILEL